MNLNIKMTPPNIEELKQNTGKPRRGIDEKNGKDWSGLHLGKFEKRWPTFFQIYVTLYQNVIYTAEKSQFAHLEKFNLNF